MVVVGAHTPCLGRAVYICCSLRHGPPHRRAAGCLADCPGLRGTRLVFFPSPYTQVLLYGNRFFFLRYTHKYCSMVISFFFASPYRHVTLYGSRFFFPSPYTQIQRVPSLLFSTSPTAHLKSSLSDDDSESETFLFRRFRGRVHDNSTCLRCPTLSKGCVCSEPDDASVEEDEEEEEEEEDEEEEEVDEEGLGTLAGRA